MKGKLISHGVGSKKNVRDSSSWERVPFQLQNKRENMGHLCVYKHAYMGVRIKTELSSLESKTKRSRNDGGEEQLSAGVGFLKLRIILVIETR